MECITYGAPDNRRQQSLCISAYFFLPAAMAISYISMHTVMIQSISSPRQAGTNFFNRVSNRARAIGSVTLWLALLAICIFLSTVQFVFIWQPSVEDFESICSPNGPLASKTKDEAASDAIAVQHPRLASMTKDEAASDEIAVLYPPQSNLTRSEMQFWMQSNEEWGYTPCLNFTDAYKQASISIVKEKRKYLLVVVSGGLNQQRNQIVDAVVIARILEAALVIPVLQVNAVWGDDSEFSDIFDVDHFKNTLKLDLHIVSSLPSTHLMRRPVEEKETPLHSSPDWFHAHYLKRLNREGVLLLRGLDSRLSDDLPHDLQILRCKVAFHALRFVPAIMEVANRLLRRMRDKGPYVALHLRLEKDVWVRTGCLTGLGPKYDDEIREERILKAKLLTGRSNLTSHARKAAGQCPLNAAEIARLLKALGASSATNIFWAGGKPLGGNLALYPLLANFSNLFSKESLALEGELEAFAQKASMLAAVDYIICLNSDVFMPSHGGNMARALQGHRAYSGHLKHITPNKKEMLRIFSSSSLTTEESDWIMRDLHMSVGQPSLQMDKRGRNVIAFPFPECMCRNDISKQ